MSPKYIQTRVKQCKILAEQSTCTRRKIGAMLINPESNSVLSDGYNGPPRGAGELCGGNVCDREELGITSGTGMEIGCHHAEMNAILNSARAGVSTLGAELIITAEPCTMCAKAIHHAGIRKVYIVKGGYTGAGSTGVGYLKSNGVWVTSFS